MFSVLSLRAAATSMRSVSGSAARSAVRAFSGSADTISVVFVEPNGTEHTLAAPIEDTMLDVAQDNDIDIEGACGGEAACSTCHVIVDSETFDKLPEMSEDEEDMLDLALGLTDTSRLACQICATKDLDGMRLQLPDEVSNML